MNGHRDFSWRVSSSHDKDPPALIGRVDATRRTDNKRFAVLFVSNRPNVLKDYERNQEGRENARSYVLERSAGIARVLIDLGLHDAPLYRLSETQEGLLIDPIPRMWRSSPVQPQLKAALLIALRSAKRHSPDYEKTKFDLESLRDFLGVSPDEIKGAIVHLLDRRLVRKSFLIDDTMEPTDGWLYITPEGSDWLEHGGTVPLEPPNGRVGVAAQDRFQLDLSFVTDDEFAKILKRDKKELDAALAGQNWKTVLVLAGALLEGALAWRLRSDPKVGPGLKAKKYSAQHPDDPMYWELGELMDAAKKEGILKKGKHEISDVLRNYRNLIHPGREFRNAEKITDLEAEHAVSILQLLVRDFAAP